ncbi:DNA polymerase-3 subunit delta' [Croceifilum oryzae]|uniref:DNA polymerase-3 subunit delta n=1 Tax=Croceifilum oryzae TaxID=1553429 RepID=A0AAJ1WQY8_9BACL|nr:DNA polymerase III subunit delta' [Croceifilum oryzae]MDQ0418017.1 DNA polymerase-3 subunit delta' [Croceifilum oryzae]
MSFQSYPTQKRVIEFLQTAIRQDRVAHGYLFYGPKGTYKREMALEFAKAINCEQSQLDPCDECLTCKQIQSGNHPDVLVIEPDGNVIKMEQIKQLQHRFRYQSAEGMTRVVILDSADQMRMETANTLLKFLEEPISPMLAILITEQEKSIVQTVRSRCQMVRFVEPSWLEQAKMWQAHGIDPPMNYVLAQCSQEFEQFEMDSEELERIFRHVIDWSQLLVSKQSIAIIAIQEPWFQELIQKKQVTLILDFLMIWLRYVSRLAIGMADENMADFIQQGSTQAKRTTQSVCAKMMEQVMITRKLVARPELSNQSLIEQFVIRLQKDAPSDWTKLGYN